MFNALAGGFLACLLNLPLPCNSTKNKTKQRKKLESVEGLVPHLTPGIPPWAWGLRLGLSEFLTSQAASRAAVMSSVTLTWCLGSEDHSFSVFRYQKEWSHIDIWALNDVLLVLWEIPEIGGQMAVRTNVSGKSGGKKSSLDIIRSVLLTRGQLSLLGLDTLG